MARSGRRSVSVTVYLTPEEARLLDVVRAARAQQGGAAESKADLVAALVTGEADRLRKDALSITLAARDALDAAADALARATPERPKRMGRPPRVAAFPAPERQSEQLQKRLAGG